MKIACIGKGQHPATLGGVETFQRNLLDIFKENDFKVFCYKTKREKIFKNLNNIIEIDNTNNIIEKILLKILGRKRLLKIKLKLWKPDIIIINTANDLKFLKNFKSKIILVQHGSFEYYMNGTFDKEKVLNLIRKRVDKLIALSKYDRKKFNDFLKLDEQKIEVIRHTTTTPLLKNLKQKDKKLIVVSRLDKNKRIDFIIKAMSKLNDFSLEIYGEGEEKKNLEMLVKELNLNNVWLKGSTDKIVEVLDNNSLFVMASDFEGYPISCIEAMCRGLPLIIRNTFLSAQDIIKGNGALISSKWDEKEYLKAVRDVYEHYEEFSNNSLEMAKRYNIEVIREKWEKIIYEE